MHRQSQEFEQAEAHFTARLHSAEFVKHHPEYLAHRASFSALIAADKNVHPVFAAAVTQSLDKRDNRAPMLFRARVGKRPSFATSAEAVQYESGFNSFPNQPWGPADSPRMLGYIHAEEALAEALSAKEERRTSDFAELVE
jgi:hypothetical protein